jgi:hypothetical protein
MTRSSCFPVVLLILVGGCFQPEKPSLFSPDPSVKIPAMPTADLNDPKVARQFVKDLDSDDPAVRFYAIKRLEEITGNSFGYRYYDDEIERAPAIAQWKKWLADRDPTSRPATTQSASW